MADTDPHSGTLTRINRPLQALPHPSEISLGDSGVTADELKEIPTIVFGPVAALVGAAVGYYFGSRETG